MGRKVMAFAGIITLLQAIAQAIFSSLSLAQYYCLVDFLRDLPLLIYIKIMYYHNINCGTRINIGQVIDGIPDQAMVLLTKQPLTVTRAFYINCTSLGLSVIWLLASIILMASGTKPGSRPTRWPWIITSIGVGACDVIATVIFANDSFYSRTLSEMMNYIGGTVSGIGNNQLDTSATAWIMATIYSRFAIFFLINILLIVIVAIDKSNPKKDVSVVENSEPPPAGPVSLQITRTQTPEPVNEHPRRVSEPIVRSVSQIRSPIVAASLTNITEASVTTKDTEDSTIRGDETPKIPRAGFNNAFRTMKRLLFSKVPLSPRRASDLDSLDPSPERSPQLQHVGDDKKRSVNFPQTLLSLPQRLENLIAEQQRRLDQAVVDTGRNSVGASQSLPQLNDSNDGNPTINRGRRDTAAELQGQLPWAYIPAPAHRMRDQLPPDEDLPPVPLPDYTAIHSTRKASVHRAASSLSSLTQKKNYISQLPRLSPLTQSDVLY